MTWEELKEKAKGINGVLICGSNSMMPEHIWLNELIFYKNGRIILDGTDDEYCSITHTIANNRTPEQMWKIMEALK